MEDNQHPIFTSNDFAGNMAAISTDHYNGRKPEDLSLGFVIIRSSLAGPQESLFVGSQSKQYSSAMIFGWWMHTHGRNISREDESLIGTIYAEHWNYKPGSGPHRVIDFLRGALVAEETVTIDPINEVIDNLYARISELKPTNVNPAHRNAIGWVIDMLDCRKLGVPEKRIKNGEEFLDIPDNTYEWLTHQWIRKVLHLFMKISDNKL